MLYMPFLYFPEDKTEYIPAVIMLVIFMLMAAAAMYFVIRKSKKDEEKFDDKYNEQIREIKKESDKN